MENRYVHTTEVHNKLAPSVIVPIILELVKPKSVIDVGCGTGTFLSVFQEYGVKEVLGIEGEWLDKSKLQVDESLIIVKDLEQPFIINKKFELALCLEVVEHLSESAADVIVDTLTKLSDVIVFSGAVPGQIGQRHLNEQWVDYWKKKFEKREYFFYDELRSKLWDNKDVDVWYKQNMFYVIKAGKNNYNFEENQKIVNKIHPEFFTNYRYMFKRFLEGKIPLNLFMIMLKNRIKFI